MKGHNVHGGGATVTNCPIDNRVDNSNTVTLHIHIHGGSETLIAKAGRALSGLFSGTRPITIEKASQLSDNELQWSIRGELVDRCGSRLPELGDTPTREAIDAGAVQDSMG